MEDITFPMLVKKPFENITYSIIDNYSVGDIFNYNPRNVMHIALIESGFLEYIKNSECEYIAMRELELDKIFEIGDNLQYEDIPE